MLHQFKHSSINVVAARICFNFSALKLLASLITFRTAVIKSNFRWRSNYFSPLSLSPVCFAQFQEDAGTLCRTCQVLSASSKASFDLLYETFIIFYYIIGVIRAGGRKRDRIQPGAGGGGVCWEYGAWGCPCGRNRRTHAASPSPFCPCILFETYIHKQQTLWPQQ